MFALHSQRFDDEDGNNDELHIISHIIVHLLTSL